MVNAVCTILNLVISTTCPLYYTVVSFQTKEGFCYGIKSVLIIFS